jgi:arylsulfatase A-like enzyme
MGNPAAMTPHLDTAVATDAVSFRNAFCQNPVCTPSRCSFMTGLYPHVSGHRTMYHMLRPHEPMLLSVLRGQGYFVWWGGKNDLVPAQNGYADYCDIKYAIPRPQELPVDYHARNDWRGEPGSDTYYSFYKGRLGKHPGETRYRDGDWSFVEGAIEFIRNRPADRPLCIYLPLTYPHPPYHVEDPFYSAIDRSKLPPRTPATPDESRKPSLLKGIRQRQNLRGWTEDRWTELRATYYGMCARVDRQYGLILEALRQAGIYDDTAVFCFSDHGDFTGDYGLVEKTQNTFEDCLTRVPFVIKPPASVPVKPRVSEAITELIDFSATVYDMAGISPPYSHFGRSLLPVLAGETDELRDAAFCEGGRLYGECHAMELQSKSTDPTGLYWPRLSLQQQDDGPEHTKAIMCRTKEYKYVRRLYESDELYDLRNDPREEHNRIDDPALSGVLTQLKERMLRWLMETCDTVPFEGDLRG